MIGWYILGILAYLITVGTHTSVLVLGYVLAKPYLDKRLNKPTTTTKEPVQQVTQI